jgi:hypothetical protein
MCAVTWSVVALEAPRVSRRCPRCGEQRRFFSSDKFRINAQKRRLDVWLIHKCEACDFTWNLTVLERVLPQDIDPSRYRRFLDNDRHEAWACAFAGPGDRGVAWDVHIAGVGEDIVVRLVHPVEIRLERLAARALGLRRGEVARHLDVPRGALRRRVRDGQRFSRTAPPPGGRDSEDRSDSSAPSALDTAPWPQTRRDGD